MKKSRLRTIILLLALFQGVLMYASEQELPARSRILALARKVNNYWIANHFDPGNNQWARAAYFVGNTEFYKTYPGQPYLDYAIAWAEKNNWAINGGTSTSNADNHACGQVYIDLFLLNDAKDSTQIEAIKKAIDYRIENHPESADWWWVDALFMAMPTIARLGAVYNDSRYFDKLYDLFRNTRDTLIVNSGWSQASADKYAPGPIVTCPSCGNDSDGLYNKADGLWWRDWRYQPAVPPQNDKPKQSPNGKNIYWSRGNGWALAALARTLPYLPETGAHRQEYETIFTEMAEALKNCQREDGFWNMNLADPEHYPAPETSGTAFFTYGLAWGINNALLDRNRYYPVVAKAWNGLAAIAIQPNGNVKYAQNVGEAPIEPSRLTTSSVDFAVGALLLAASEVSKLAFDDGLPGDEELPENNDTLLDRSDWEIVTSSEGVGDVAVGGDDPRNIIDGDLQSAFLFVKPGKTYNGITVAPDTKPWFVVNLKKTQDMTSIFYRHRDYDNTTPYLRANKASFYGKNAETEEFQPIIENFDIPTDDAETQISLPGKVSYSRVKFVFEAWNTSGGYTIQTSEFNLGNTDGRTKIPTLPDRDGISIYPNPVKAGQPFYIRLNSKLSDITVSIYTVWGVKLAERKYKTRLIEQIIDRKGTYLVEIRKTTEKYATKIVVNDKI